MPSWSQGGSLTQQLRAEALGCDSLVRILTRPLTSCAVPIQQPHLFIIYEMWVIIGPTPCAVKRTKWRPYNARPRVDAQSVSAFLSFPPSWLLGSPCHPGGAAFALLYYPGCPFSVKQHRSDILGREVLLGGRCEVLGACPSTGHCSPSAWWSVLPVTGCCGCPLCGPAVQKKTCLGIL